MDKTSRTVLIILIVALVVGVAALVLGIVGLVQDGPKGPRGDSVTGPQGPEGLTQHEIDQLNNIGSALISGTAWTNVSNLDQSVSTTSDVQFGTIRSTNPSDFFHASFLGQIPQAFAGPSTAFLGTFTEVGTPNNFAVKVAPNAHQIEYSGTLTRRFVVSYNFSIPIDTAGNVQTFVAVSGTAGPALTRVDHLAAEYQQHSTATIVELATNDTVEFHGYAPSGGQVPAAPVGPITGWVVIVPAW